jgi:hypothetical protein
MPPPVLVLDASVTLAWAFEDEVNAYPDFVLESLAEAKACVPTIWPLEVGNALLVVCFIISFHFNPPYDIV